MPPRLQVNGEVVLGIVEENDVGEGQRWCINLQGQRWAIFLAKLKQFNC